MTIRAGSVRLTRLSDGAKFDVGQMTFAAFDTTPIRPPYRDETRTIEIEVKTISGAALRALFDTPGPWKLRIDGNEYRRRRRSR